MGGELTPPGRNIDYDAPTSLRNELVDLAFYLAEHNSGAQPTDYQVYHVICQSLGFTVSTSPMSSYRARCSRDINQVPWPRVYDLILRLGLEFMATGLFEEYRSGVNSILASHGIVWDLDDLGKLRRVLPAPAQAQINAAVQELAAPQFAPALLLFESARNAYDDRPRRDRDACANMFDAMESVVKEKYTMPHATFGQVLSHIGQNNAHTVDVVDVLRRVNDLRNHNFGHGMTTTFSLTPAEVDFTYLVCVSGILLFVRTP